MRKQFLAAMALAIPFALSVAPASASAQPDVVETQANPPGDRPVSDLPPDPATADSPVPATMPQDPGYRGGPYTGALSAPPPEAMGKDYPLCSATRQDSCVNPREAGMNYGNRPLAYWPGEPASARGSGWHRASRYIPKRPRN